MVAAVTYAEVGVGTSFRAQLRAESVARQFPAGRLAKRIGKLRPVEVVTAVDAKFYAELVGAQPEKWRLDFETFAHVQKREGGEEVRETFEIGDRAFFVELGPGGATVTDEHGGPATPSQTTQVGAVAAALAERQPWGKFAGSREFAQGKIVEAPAGLVPGRYVAAIYGPVQDGNSTASFFRFGEDATKAEVAHFEVHSRFKTDNAAATDESYYDFEARGKAVLRMDSGFLLGYDVSAKVTPRAKTGAMLPEGSGKWSMSLDIDAQTLQIR